MVEFVFEMKLNKRMENISKESFHKLRKMMVEFETQVNTTLPELRVHLREI